MADSVLIQPGASPRFGRRGSRMEQPQDDFTPPELKKEDAFNVITSPYWLLAFILLSIPFFVLLTYVGSQIPVQTTTIQQVYAFNALFAGLAADIVLRKWLRVALVVLRRPRLPFVVVWVVACLVVFTFRPF